MEVEVEICVEVEVWKESSSRLKRERKQNTRACFVCVCVYVCACIVQPVVTWVWTMDMKSAVEKVCGMLMPRECAVNATRYVWSDVNRRGGKKQKGDGMRVSCVVVVMYFTTWE